MNPQILEQVITNWLNQQLAGTSLTTILQPLANKINQQNQSAGSGSSSRQQDGALDKVFSNFTKTLITVIAPLTTFATILSQSTSGFSLFLTTINILAMTIAPVLLPAFVILGALVLALASQLQAELAPALDKFYEWVAVNAVDALTAFVKWIQDAYAAIQGLIEYLNSLKPDEEGPKDDTFGPDGWLAGIIGLFNPNVSRMQEGNLEERLEHGREVMDKEADRVHEEDKLKEDNAKKAQQGAQGVVGGAIAGGAAVAGQAIAGQDVKPEKRQRTGFEKDFIDGLKDMAKEFRMQNSPQANMTGLVQASRAVQMAALNISPLEQRRLQIQMKIANSLDKLVAAAEKRQKELVKE